MSIYSGFRTINIDEGDRRKTDMERGVCSVDVDGLELESVNIKNGRKFEWGYNGVLPLNLSKSILVHFLNSGNDGTEYEAPDPVVSRFCNDFVSKFGFNEWSLDSDELLKYLNSLYYELYGEKP